MVRQEQVTDLMLLAHLIKSLVSQLSGLRFNIRFFIELNVLGVKVTFEFFGNRLAMLLPLIGFLLNAVVHMQGVNIVCAMSFDRGMK